MVRHIILWRLKSELSETEKISIRAGIKSGLEGLAGVIPGLESIRVVSGGLASSTADLMLDSVFRDEAALRNYSKHPAHLEVATTRMRPFVETRLCVDFEEE